ncbi:MAG: hypothetical protein WCX73_05810 [Candidatus Pacearchaeota archaeon]|jgi:hypothetical protein
MNKKQLHRELKKIKKIITSPKTKKAVKRHLTFWDKTFNNLGDSISNGLTEKESKPIITINRFYLRLK